jgi:hypothetical protein
MILEFGMCYGILIGTLLKSMAYDNKSNIVFKQVFNYQDQSSTGTFEDES